MAMCVIATVVVAPCQCFTFGGHHTTSPARISSTFPSHVWVQPHPHVTTSDCPNGCVCQAVRAPGSNVTRAQLNRAGAGAFIRGSMRTRPVNQSSGPATEAWDPLRLISIPMLLLGCA